MCARGAHMHRDQTFYSKTAISNHGIFSTYWREGGRKGAIPNHGISSTYWKLRHFLNMHWEIRSQDPPEMLGNQSTDNMMTPPFHHKVSTSWLINISLRVNIKFYFSDKKDNRVEYSFWTKIDQNFASKLLTGKCQFRFLQIIPQWIFWDNRVTSCKLSNYHEWSFKQ